MLKLGMKSSQQRPAQLVKKALSAVGMRQEIFFPRNKDGHIGKMLRSHLVSCSAFCVRTKESRQSRFVRPQLHTHFLSYAMRGDEREYSLPRVLCGLGSGVDYYGPVKVNAIIVRQTSNYLDGPCGHDIHINSVWMLKLYTGVWNFSSKK